MSPGRGGRNPRSSTLIGGRHGDSVYASRKVAATIRAEFVTDVHPALALRAYRAQAMPAPGAEAKPRLHKRAALRTVQYARFAQDEIQDDTEGVGDEDCEQRPEDAAHSAASGVAVYVADQQDVARERGASDDSKSHHDRHRRMILVRMSGNR